MCTLFRLLKNLVIHYHYTLICISIFYPCIDGQSEYANPPPSKRRRTKTDHDVPQTPILRFAMYLKGMYRRAITTSGKFPHLMCNKFINLALVKKEQVSRSEADDFTKATLHGHIDELLKKKEPIELEEVLNPIEYQSDMKCIFIEGAPGIGKSTCVGELCRRWETIDALKEYSLVILLRLREKRVQIAQNIEDLCFHRSRELRQAVAAEIEACEGRDVLFILDGLDELPDSLRRQSVFVELIQGTYLSHCTVLVTSRPSATADLLSIARPQIHKQIEVIGFTQECIEQYAKASFDSQQQILNDFLTYISTHPTIRGMMYIPLNCTIAVEVYKHNRTANRPIPQTMTQLYIEMSLTLLKRHLGEDDPLAKHLPKQLGDLPPQLLKPFTSLAKLAFDGLVRNEVVFHELPVDFIHFGFMNSPTELYLGEKALISHSFLHLTLQEFLAAFYISQLSPSDQKGTFVKHCETAGWDVVWRFVAGLSGFHGIGWEEVQSRRGKDEEGKVVPFLIRCLYEAQEKVYCDSVLGESEVEFNGGLSLTAFDCYAIGYCVANSRYMWRLDMHSNRSLGGTLVEMMKHGLCSPCKNPPQKEHTNILILDLSTCGLNSTAFNQLADVIPLMINLSKLDVRFNPAGDGGLVKLFHSLSHLKRLHTLCMDRTNIGCSDIEALTLPSSLKKLGIGEYDMSSECSELMFKKVLSPSSLERVVFSEVNWTDEAGTLLEENNNLIELVQWYDHSTISSLVLIVKKNSHLKSLMLRTISIRHSDDIVSLLADMLKLNHSLESLELYCFFGCSIDKHQLFTLNNALQYNHTLKQLTVKSEDPTHLQNEKLDPRITLKKVS